MTTNGQKKPTYLTGEEFALMPNGELRNVLEAFDLFTDTPENVAKRLLDPKEPSIEHERLFNVRVRDAIDFLPPEVVQDKEAVLAELEKYKTKPFSNAHLARLRRMKDHQVHNYKQAELHPHRWDVNMVVKEEGDVERAAGGEKSRVTKLYGRSINSNISGAQGKVRNNGPEAIIWHGENQPEFGHPLSPEDFEEAVAIMERHEEVFPPAFKKIVANEGIPIILRKGVNLGNGAGMVVNPAHGIVMDAKVLRALESDNYHEMLGGLSSFANMVVSSFWRNRIPTFDELGLTEDVWRNIQEEVRTAAESSGGGSVADFSTVNKILSHMHFILNSGNEGLIKETEEILPLCKALYDNFCAAQFQRADEIEQGRQQREAPASGQRRAKKGDRGEAKQRKNGFGHNPKPFTGLRSEQDLIEATKPILAEMLEAEPPYTQFKCKLSHQRRKDGGYPIVLVFRNNKRETIERELATGETNLNRAITLKEALQNHVMTSDHFLSMWLSQASSDRPGARPLVTDEILPETAPSEIKLSREFGFFHAELHYYVKGRWQNPHDITALIPLGVECKDAEQDARETEANARLELLKDEMGKIQKQNDDQRVRGQRFARDFLTVGQLSQRLKRLVEAKRSDQEIGWEPLVKMAAIYKGEPATNMNLRLGFPRERDAMSPDGMPEQSTVLTGATLSYESGIKQPNPRWRITLRLRFDGLDLPPINRSINLHTSDASAAVLRGEQVIESAIKSFQELGDLSKHPSPFWWQPVDMEGKTELLIVGENDSMPVEPAPQSLGEEQDDWTHFKTDFRAYKVSDKEQPDGSHIVTLGIQRGNEREADLMPFNKNHDQPFEISFSIDNPSEINNVVGSIQHMVRRHLNMDYGNRDSEGNRQPRMRYSADRVTNMLVGAFQTEMDTCRETGRAKLKPLFASMGSHRTLIREKPGADMAEDAAGDVASIQPDPNTLSDVEPEGQVSRWSKFLPSWRKD